MDQWITVDEAAKKLNKPRSTIYSWIYYFRVNFKKVCGIVYVPADIEPPKNYQNYAELPNCQAHSCKFNTSGHCTALTERLYKNGVCPFYKRKRGK